MKNKKTVIIIVSVIVTYLILAIVLFGWENFTNKIYDMNIVFSTGAKWQLKDGRWEDIKDEEQYNWKKFDVYVDNQLIGNYNLLYNNFYGICNR